jgi:hypothetical protein
MVLMITFMLYAAGALLLIVAIKFCTAQPISRTRITPKDESNMVGDLQAWLRTHGERP